MQVATVEHYYSNPLNCEHLTTDSKSEKEDSERESGVERTITTGRKRRTAGS